MVLSATSASASSGGVRLDIVVASVFVADVTVDEVEIPLLLCQSLFSLPWLACRSLFLSFSLTLYGLRGTPSYRILNADDTYLQY